MKVVFLWNECINGIESFIFKSIIFQEQRPYELPGFEQDCERIDIENGYGNDVFGNVVIENYPRLETLKVASYSLVNINSVTINNNGKLKSVDFDEVTFVDVNTLIMESKFSNIKE